MSLNLQKDLMHAEFTYVQVQWDAAHRRLAERLRNHKKQLLTQENEEGKITTGQKT